MHTIITLLTYFCWPIPSREFHEVICLREIKSWPFIMAFYAQLPHTLILFWIYYLIDASDIVFGDSLMLVPVFGCWCSLRFSLWFFWQLQQSWKSRDYLHEALADNLVQFFKKNKQTKTFRKTNRKTNRMNNDLQSFALYSGLPTRHLLSLPLHYPSGCKQELQVSSQNQQ